MIGAECFILGIGLQEAPEVAIWQTVNSRQRRRKRLILVLGLLVLVSALFAGLSAWQKWFWFAKPALVQTGFPGRKQADKPGFTYMAKEASVIESKLDQLLKEQGFLVHWYRPVSLAGKVQAQKTGSAALIDQVLYGQYLLEQGKKKTFLAWWDSLESHWPRPGAFASWQDEADINQEADYLAANLALVRVLAQSLTLWPDADRLVQLEQISDELYTGLAAGSAGSEQVEVPAATQVPDLAATPTRKPVGPEEKEELLLLDVLPLASVDLFALQVLAQIEERWQPVYNNYLTVVQDGFLAGQLPLFAYAYEPASQSYLPYAGTEPLVDTESALLTILHLSECGQAPLQSIGWIRDQFYNEGSLYKAYHAAQGTAVDKEESILAYALVARIARIIEDQTLYETAAKRLLWHQVTNQASEAYGLVFSQQPDGSALVYAADNVWTLLALD